MGTVFLGKILDPFRREKNGIFQRGTPIPKKEESPYLFVFQCNAYSDGNGDIGNLIDVATQIIDHYGIDHVIPVFVITASSAGQKNKITTQQLVQEALEYFKKEAGYAFQKYANPIFHSFTFSPEHKCNYTIEDENFNTLIQTTELKNIYPVADAVFNIATPFPSLPRSIKLKQGAQIINITEHNFASSKWDNSSNVEEHHYVTGIKDNNSGLMVKENSCDLNGSVKALQAIQDKRYIEKLGLIYPVPFDEARSFLEQTLVVPVYLGDSQQQDLAPLIHLVSQSPLGQDFKKIIFHVNKRAYDEDIYKEANAQLQTGPSPEVVLIVGHYFDDPEDFQRIYQLSSNRGVAICSSDKVLEKAISCSLFPLYPPVRWKVGVYADFVDFVKEDPEHSKLFEFLGKTSSVQDVDGQIPNNILDLSSNFQAAKKCMSGNIQDLYNIEQPDYNGKKMLKTLSEDSTISSSLTSEVIQRWKENKRPILLKNSFYTVLQNQVLTPNLVQEKEEIKQTITEAFPKDSMKFWSNPSDIAEKHDTKGSILNFK